MFPVENDDTLGRLIALLSTTACLAAERRGSGGSMQHLGWEDSLVNKMSAMPITDVAKILNKANACMGVMSDHRNAVAFVNSWRAIKRDDAALGAAIESSKRYL